MRYEIIIKPAAEKGLDKIPRSVRRRIADALEELRSDPRPRGALKLTDLGDVWRMRVGEYRVVYEIDDRRATVTVLRVAHRKDVYRG